MTPFQWNVNSIYIMQSTEYTYQRSSWNLKKAFGQQYKSQQDQETQ